jgi:hypothetical protein
MPVFTLAVQNAFPKTRLGEVTAGTQLFRNVGGTVGTAILGGIMNSRLSSEVAKLKDEPFIASVKELPKMPGDHSGGSLIQEVLNPAAQSMIRNSIRHGSPDTTASLKNFDHFLLSSKQAFSGAVDHVFIVAAILMSVAFVVVCFLPEIPLRKSDKPAMEIEGEVLQDEFGQKEK